MPTFAENALHLQAANNIRLAVMELSKLGLIIRRMQSKAEALIEIAPNTTLTPEKSTDHWHMATVMSCKVCWSAKGEIENE